MSWLRIGAGVDLRGIKPVMQDVSPIVVEAFAIEGFDCVLTSAVRLGDVDSLHGYGFAKDYDSTQPVPLTTGNRIAAMVSQALGAQFDVLWHKTKSGRYHLHVEFDPDGRGVRPHLLVT